MEEFLELIESLLNTLWSLIISERINIGKIVFRVFQWLIIPLGIIILILIFVNYKSEEESKKSILSYKTLSSWRNIGLKYISILIIMYTVLSFFWPELSNDDIFSKLIAIVSIVLFLFGEHKKAKLNKYIYLLQNNNISHDSLSNLFEVKSASSTKDDIFINKRAKKAMLDNKDIIKFSMEVGQSSELYDLYPKNDLVALNINFIIEQLNRANDIKAKNDLGNKVILFYKNEELTHYFSEFLYDNPHFEKMNLIKLFKITCLEIKDEYFDGYKDCEKDFILVTRKIRKKTMNSLNDMIFLNASPDNSNNIDINLKGRSRLRNEKVEILFDMNCKQPRCCICIIGPKQEVFINIFTGYICANETSVPASINLIAENWLKNNIKEILKVWNKYNKNCPLKENEIYFYKKNI